MIPISGALASERVSSRGKVCDRCSDLSGSILGWFKAGSISPYLPIRSGLAEKPLDNKLGASLSSGIFASFEPFDDDRDLIDPAVDGR